MTEEYKKRLIERVEDLETSSAFLLESGVMADRLLHAKIVALAGYVEALNSEEV